MPAGSPINRNLEAYPPPVPHFFSPDDLFIRRGVATTLPYSLEPAL